ncbi:MAG: aminotransferase class I/II-fold pyridoxal phosphate-dependent enzyme [Lachnospiraceae bacterium]|nr:aminotransferase class I/II-fold pyridoxal phosphate-dependent enzyme [Lachnospiraceae bacterium]
MDIVLSQRMEGYEEGVFQVLNEMVKARLSRGEKVYDFTVGTPDFEAAPYVREAVAKAAADPENYKYSLGDMPELTKALTDRYESRYGVKISASNIASVYGSQEGMAHVAFPFCNPGDVVLVPDPGYPIFSMGPAMAGAKIVKYDLYREKNYILDLADIPEETARAAKMIIVSYPLNPVCTAAPYDFYKDLIAWAKKYQVLVLHDNAYSDIIFDGRKGISFLSLPGAMEVGVEFYSLSKSYNLTGARVSFLIGNEKMVGSFKRFRSQFDYGLFKVVQYAAIAALTLGDEDVRKQCEEYQRRRDLLCGGFRKLGWDMPDSEGTMFAWGAIPAKGMGSVDFVKDLFEKTGVLCTPGISFGARGEGYVRFALNHDEAMIRQALEAAGSYS